MKNSITVNLFCNLNLAEVTRPHTSSFPLPFEKLLACITVMGIHFILVISATRDRHHKVLSTTAHIILNSLCRDNSSILLDFYCLFCAKQHSWAERDFPNGRKQKSLACLKEYIVWGQVREREISYSLEQLLYIRG